MSRAAHIRAAMYCVAAAAAGALMLIYPAKVGASVSDAVTACLEVMIPSLYAFTVLAVYLQSSGLYRAVLKPLTLPLSRIMQLEEELCAVFILSNIGGYPVGARLISGLTESGRLSREDASRMMCFCFGSGPSFVIGIAGMGIFGSAGAGAMIFLACFLASFTVGVFVCRRGTPIKLTHNDNSFDLGGECFISSVAGAGKVMFTVCSMILGFSVVTALLELCGINGIAARLAEAIGAGENAPVLLPAALEISRLRGLAPCGAWVIPACAALLSFGGVCVIMQVCALAGGSVSIKPFLLSRIPAAALSAVFSAGAFLIPPAALGVYSPNTANSEAFSVNAGLSACVLIMSGILMYSVEKSRQSR